MALINYEALLYGNFNLARLIDAKIPLPAVDIKFGTSLLNDVSENTTKYKGQPLKCPYYEVPLHPFLRCFLKSLKASIEIIKNYMKRHNPHNQDLKDNLDLKNHTFDENDSIFSEDLDCLPEVWPEPTTNPNGSVPECLQVVDLLLQQAVDFNENHNFCGRRMRWHTKRLYRVCHSVHALWVECWRFIPRFDPKSTAIPSPILLTQLAKVLEICKHMWFYFSSKSDTTQVWTHMFRPPSFEKAWKEGLASYKEHRSSGSPVRTLPAPSRNYMSELINARAAEISTNIVNHIVLNVRQRVTSFVLFKLARIQETPRRRYLASSVVNRLFSDDASVAELQEDCQMILNEIVDQVHNIPLLSWSSNDSILPLRDSPSFCDHAIIPGYLYLFRYFEQEYRRYFEASVEENPANQDDQEKSNQEQSPQTPSLNRQKSKFSHFSLIPLPNFDGCFIEIEHTALYNLVKSMPESCRSQFQSFKENSSIADEKSLFNEVFYYPEDETRLANKKAGIKTDGESIRLCMYNTKTDDAMPNKNYNEKLESDIQYVKNLMARKQLDVYGVDPGIKRPVQAVNLSHLRDTKRGKVFRTSAINNGHYQHLNWSNRHWMLRHKRLQDNSAKDARKAIDGMPSGRTTLTDSLSLLVKYVVPLLQFMLVPFSTTRKVKSWRFVALGARQSALAFVVKLILCKCDRRLGKCVCNMHRYSDPNSTRSAIVAYGAAKFNPGMRGNAPAPNAMIARGIERLAKVKVLMMDEFRSSKRCCVCHENLIAPLLPATVAMGKQSEIMSYEVQQCSNINCSAYQKFWNRDINASINMASLLLYAINSKDPLDRPQVFNRSTPPPKFEWFEAAGIPKPSYKYL